LSWFSKKKQFFGEVTWFVDISSMKLYFFIKKFAKKIFSKKSPDIKDNCLEEKSSDNKTFFEGR
jgi:hypothetical protein